MKLITSRNKEKLENRREDIYRELTEVGEVIERAKAYGDLSENEEFSTAAENQKRLLAELTDINDKLDGAKVVQGLVSSEVSIGSYIRVTELNDNNEPVTEPKLFVVDSIEDYFGGSLGIDSPLGKQILGNPSGIYTVNTNFGLIIKYKVEILRDPNIDNEFDKSYPRNYKMIGEEAAFEQEDGTFKNSEGDLVDKYNRKIDSDGNLLESVL